MRVVISDDGPDEFEYDFDQEAVILGRGSNCDIVLQSDHISRKHLEISRKNGIFFIKDLTLSNWVSYNDEKLHKNVEVQYFDFAPLLLPGGFSVKIEDENEVSTLGEEVEREKENSRSQKIDIYKTKLSSAALLEDRKIKRQRERAVKREEMELKKKAELKKYSILFAVLLAVGGYFYFEAGGFKEENTPKVIADQPVKPQPIRKVKQKVYTGEKIVEAPVKKKEKNKVDYQKIFSDLQNSQVGCTPLLIENLCKTILNGKGVSEKIYADKNKLIVFKNIRLRFQNIFQANYDLISRLMNYDGAYEFTAAESILDNKTLEGIEKDRFREIIVYVFIDTSLGDKLSKIFKIDTSIYRKYSTRDWEFAVNELKTKQRLRYFNKNFKKYIELVHEVK
ncbi:MAG: FHA domain-containing protein [Bdellovibrionota bacterium]|nr:FHA domain-containing protein [Bdellovibrionota bacterium]